VFVLILGMILQMLITVPLSAFESNVYIPVPYARLHLTGPLSAGVSRPDLFCKVPLHFQSNKVNSSVVVQTVGVFPDNKCQTSVARSHV